MNIEKITDTNINCFSCDKNRIDSVIQLKCCNVYICDECLFKLAIESLECLEVDYDN